MEQDDELHEVGVSLLPERLLPSAEEVVDEGGDAVGERVGIETVVERVVAVLGIEADFDVVRLAAETSQNRANLSAEVALYLQNETAYPFFGVRGFVGQNLFGIGIQAPAGLSTTNGAEDGNSGEQTTFWNGEPVGCFGWL